MPLKRRVQVSGTGNPFSLIRVPLDYTGWQIGQTWQGYINPYKEHCPNPDCHEGKLTAFWFLRAIAALLRTGAEDSYTNGNKRPSLKRRGDTIVNTTGYSVLHAYFKGFPLTAKDTQNNLPMLPASTELITLVKGLVRKGHDETNIVSENPKYWGSEEETRIIARLAIAAGLFSDTQLGYTKAKRWGVCSVCKGTNLNPQKKADHDNWRSYGPPKGEAWQLWKGSAPVTPPAESLEVLAAICVQQPVLYPPGVQLTAKDWYDYLEGTKLVRVYGIRNNELAYEMIEVC